MVASGAFPAFCHISEYDDFGYQVLHRMLAMSDPLILWSPTSAQLEQEKCRISPSDFIDYVETDRVRVFGRERWLTSRTFRDNHPFQKARWNESFDGRLKKICEEDADKPLNQRKVVAAPAEEGWRWAEEYLADNPKQVLRWSRLAHSKSAADKIPTGTLEAAFKYSDDDPFRLAQAILRDAYNHGQAVNLTNAKVPFLLSDADQKFLKVLEETADPGREGGRGRGRPVSSAPVLAVDATGAQLATQMLRVLQFLDIGSPKRRRPRDLNKFLNGDGHHELVSWLSDLCEELKRMDARNLDNAVISELRASLSSAKFGDPLREMLTDPAGLSVGTVSLITVVIGFILDPAVPLATIGFSAAAVSIIRGLLRALGYVPSSFNGPQWPFLYTYHSRTKKRQLAHLLDVLSEA